MGTVGITVQDLTRAESPEAYVAVLQRWARAVWGWWADERGRVAELLKERHPDRADRRR